MQVSDLKIVNVKLSELKLDKKNARKHNAKNLATIKSSLEKFGQLKNIVIDSDYNIVCGNGTVTAAREIGWTSINAAVTDLKGADLIAFALADNRSAELAEWDEDVKAELLAELELDGFDIGEIGFNAIDSADDSEEIFEETVNNVQMLLNVPENWYKEAIKPAKSAIKKSITDKTKIPEENDLADFVLFSFLLKKYCEEKKKRFSVVLPLTEELWSIFRANPSEAISGAQEFLHDKHKKQAS